VAHNKYRLATVKTSKFPGPPLQVSRPSNNNPSQPQERNSKKEEPGNHHTRRKACRGVSPPVPPFRGGRHHLLPPLLVDKTKRAVPQPDLKHLCHCQRPRP
ncbi:unnamed protein product, partial [Ectocarpus sp. 4 AP-2014]